MEDHMVGMERLRFEFDVSHGDTILWAAIMIATSADSTFTSSHKRWLILDWILDIEPYAKWKWAKALQVVQEYFWDDSISTRGEACWQEALGRKQQRHAQQELDRGMVLRGQNLQGQEHDP
jgi:hypothetical protein